MALSQLEKLIAERGKNALLGQQVSELEDKVRTMSAAFVELPHRITELRDLLARQRAALISLAERVRREGAWATTEDQWALWNAEAVAREEVP